MYFIKKMVFTLIAVALIGSVNLFAQKGGHGHGGHGGIRHGGKVAVIKGSRFRPAKIVVWHPGWGPKRAFNRRWIFFPRYNFYWDNWRNVYVYRNGTVWVNNSTPPPTVVNVNIDNEKHYELKENEDDTDEVYSNNESHSKDYKPE